MTGPIHSYECRTSRQAGFNRGLDFFKRTECIPWSNVQAWVEKVINFDPKVQYTSRDADQREDDAERDSQVAVDRKPESSLGFQML